jgi:biotin synthase-like enzyme
MPVEERNIVKEIGIDAKLDGLLNEASRVYSENFDGTAWLGRCIFLSWYCSLGTCTFCFRSTQKHKIKFGEEARRTKESIFTEALIAKSQGWKLEFLTGGYNMYSIKELEEICKACSEIFEEKVWVNFGALTNEDLQILAPHLDGVVASVETLNPTLHKEVCPDKPIEPFEMMLLQAKKLNLRRSITIVLGLGETFEDYKYVHDFINKYELSRITYYSLRPVFGTAFNKGPAPEDVLKWIATTRIDFPKIEIIAGTAETRIPEINYLLKAGANAVTKLPATKIFATTGAEKIHEQVNIAKRKFSSDLLKLKDFDWKRQLDKTDLNEALKQRILDKLKEYEKNRLNKAYKGFELLD